MQEHEMAEKNRIMECISGSHLYGFAIESSDEDFRGVFVPDKDYVLGLNSIEQIEQKDPDDRVLYSIGKFFKLALANNPNIIELLYIPNDKMIYSHSIWEKVSNNRNLFLSKKCKHSFGGYAHAQLKRLQAHKKWLSDPLENPPKKDDFINTMTLEVGKEAQIIQSGWDEIKVTEIYPGVEKNPYENGYTPDTVDIQYFRKDEYESALRKHHQYLDWKKNRNKARAELEKKYNYDGKHGGHLIRLLKMCVEILEEETIHVDRSTVGDAQLYLDIRDGKYSYDELISMANELENKCNELYEVSNLRHAPDINKINELLIEIYEEYWK